ncbi:hypothetical protein CCMSSC00406_0006803 [Pleurotus cornucopiae]|uniref:Uncharacterized protein n=1 Tax=Pleurotus cornucopiae TaxID=5321 RepID=A0ACB7J1P0_PLECO|nr:hypothetical protein CCMSSC00406_0006803 [Pleurotus cornucopiae]
MSVAAHTTPSGYLLPSIHSAPPFFTKQINPTTRSIADDHWTRIILGYARHRRLFTLRVEDAETSGNDWDEIFRNERINRRLLPDHLASLISSMVTNNLAVYEPPKQTRSVLLYWRRPEEWADVLHSWVASTGQMNTIMTFYEITDPPVESPLSSLPIVILRKAIDVLSKSGRAQIIAIADGEGEHGVPPFTDEVFCPACRTAFPDTRHYPALRNLECTADLDRVDHLPPRLKYNPLSFVEDEDLGPPTSDSPIFADLARIEARKKELEERKASVARRLVVLRNLKEESEEVRKRLGYCSATPRGWQWVLQPAQAVIIKMTR